MTTVKVRKHDASTTTAAGTGSVLPYDLNSPSSSIAQVPLSEGKPAIDGTGQLAAGRVLFLGALLLFVGTMGFYFLPGMIVLNEDDLEKTSNRNHLVDSFYCAAITLTTVGFGDICPGETNFFGKMFLVFFSLSGLGIFCGPIMEVASAWKNEIPGGLPTLASFTIGIGALLFTTIEGLAQMDAIYASVITATTIGYGDFAPHSNMGKIAVALYAITSVNVMAILLQPARHYLELLCRVKPKMD
ncbi:hypothetical protein ACA910_000209 [Epithemia clementina (nom. ined.)]